MPRGRQQAPDDDELLFLEALILRELGDPARAETTLLRLLAASAARGYANMGDGLRGYKARHLLADVYRCQRRWAEAEAQWRLVVAEQPRFAPAWQGLGELFLAQGRWTELEVLMGQRRQGNVLPAP